MYSTARKLSTFCSILSVINITGLIMLGLLALNADLPFYLIFTLSIYAITTTVMALLLTLAVRNFVQDADLDSENTSMRIKKINDRLNNLEATK